MLSFSGAFNSIFARVAAASARKTACLDNDFVPFEVASDDRDFAPISMIVMIV